MIVLTEAQTMQITYYGLCDERFPGVFRYIGMTDDIERRMLDHNSVKWNNGAARTIDLWKRCLRMVDSLPVVTVLETVRCRRLPDFPYVPQAVAARETELIWKYARAGHPLLNREVRDQVRIDSGISAKDYAAYRRMMLLALSRRDKTALEFVRIVEDRNPSVFNILHPGNMHETLKDWQWNRQGDLWHTSRRRRACFAALKSPESREKARNRAKGSQS
jgi:hypothetical protein